MLASTFLASLLLLGPAAPASPGPVIWPEHREQLEVLPEDELDLDEAKRLFSAGKQAAERGRWDEAVRYFAEAYRHSGSPGQLYSLGRGHRELYFHEGRDPVQLRLALLRFEQYLEQSPDGRNRDNARRYIEELRPYVTVLEGFDQPVEITRLMIYSPVDTAVVSIDGGPTQAAPLTLDVEPGSHRIQLSAPGYHDTTRTVEVPRGATVPLELSLHERPASLGVRGPSGAALYVDGQPSGQLPLSAELQLPPGPHQVAIAQAGHTAFVRELELSRGSEQELDVELPMTAQRKLSFAAMGLGAAGVLTAGTLTGLALRRQAQARAIEQERRTQGISEDRYAEGQQAWRGRDALRTAAITTGVVGALALGTGVVLFFTDDPALGDRLYRPERIAGRRRSLRAAPVATSDGAGAVLIGRF